MKRHSILHTLLITTVLVSGVLLLIALTNKYILTPDFYDRNGYPLSGIPDQEAAAYLGIRHTIYLWSAIYTLIKILFVTLVLYTGMTFFNIKLRFAELLRIVVACEFIFLIPAAFKIWWFYYYVPDATLGQWENYYFLSAASIFNDIRPSELYPLETINVFEFAYWFLLAGGIKKLSGNPFDLSLRVVLCSYVPALFVWIIIVTFMSILYFPQSY